MKASADQQNPRKESCSRQRASLFSTVLTIICLSVQLISGVASAQEAWPSLAQKSKAAWDFSGEGNKNGSDSGLWWATFETYRQSSSIHNPLPFKGLTPCQVDVWYDLSRLLMKLYSYDPDFPEARRQIALSQKFYSALAAYVVMLPESYCEAHLKMPQRPDWRTPFQELQFNMRVLHLSTLNLVMLVKSRLDCTKNNGSELVCKFDPDVDYVSKWLDQIDSGLSGNRGIAQSDLAVLWLLQIEEYRGLFLFERDFRAFNSTRRWKQVQARCDTLFRNKTTPSLEYNNQAAQIISVKLSWEEASGGATTYMWWPWVQESMARSMWENPQDWQLLERTPVFGTLLALTNTAVDITSGTDRYGRPTSYAAAMTSAVAEFAFLTLDYYTVKALGGAAIREARNRVSQLRGPTSPADAHRKSLELSSVLRKSVNGIRKPPLTATDVVVLDNNQGSIWLKLRLRASGKFPAAWSEKGGPLFLNDHELRQFAITWRDYGQLKFTLTETGWVEIQEAVDKIQSTANQSVRTAADGILSEVIRVEHLVSGTKAVDKRLFVPLEKLLDAAKIGEQGVGAYDRNIVRELIYTHKTSAVGPLLFVTGDKKLGRKVIPLGGNIPAPRQSALDFAENSAIEIKLTEQNLGKAAQENTAIAALLKDPQFGGNLGQLEFRFRFVSECNITIEEAKQILAPFLK